MWPLLCAGSSKGGDATGTTDLLGDVKAPTNKRHQLRQSARWLQQVLLKKLRINAKLRARRFDAARVASMVGNCSPSEVLAGARQSFRVVSLEKLDFEMVANNSPNAGCILLTEPRRLGSCDAYVSHSWHDDPGAKWAAMQSWRNAFIAQKGREPVVWFDKCCIDMTQIESNLRCLPVFLAGCSRLVLFCGPSYLSRLWLILELFTYVHMGGNIEDIELVPVLRQRHEIEDMESIHEAFEHFDVDNCQCYSVNDKERLLRIIEAALGSLDDFNRVVKELGAIVRRRYSVPSDEISPCGADPLEARG